MILLAAVPAIIIFALGIAARVASRQPVSSPIVQYTPGRASSVLRDALLMEADRRAATAVLIDLAVARKVRILAGASRRDPIGVELQPGAEVTSDEFAVLVCSGPKSASSTRARASGGSRPTGAPSRPD